MCQCESFVEGKRVAFASAPTDEDSVDRMVEHPSGLFLDSIEGQFTLGVQWGVDSGDETVKGLKVDHWSSGLGRIIRTRKIEISASRAKMLKLT